jgi:capsular exopolysaccharide synthesis family protein
LADCTCQIFVIITYEYKKSFMENRGSIDLDLSRYLVMVKRRWIPATSIWVATIVLSALATTLLKPSYLAEGKILFKNPSFKVAGSSLVPSQSEGSDSGDLKPLVATQNPITSQMEVLNSNPLLQKVIDYLKLKDKKNQPIAVKDFQSKLNLKIVGGSDVLQITYKSDNREEAAKVVNTLIKLYLENDIQANQSEAEATRLYMDKQLPRTQAAVDRAELALRQFKQQNNVVDLGEESKSAVAMTGNLETGISTTRSQLEDITAQSNELRQKLNLSPQQAIAVSSISQSPAIQSSLTQLQDIDRQLATEQSRFSETNPIVMSLKDRRANLAILIQQQVKQTIGSQTKVPLALLRISDLKQGQIKDFFQLEVQRIGLTKKLLSLSSSLSNYEKRISVIPKLIQTQRQLERNLDIAQTTNQVLSKKVQELQVVSKKNVPGAQVIASAVVPKNPETGTSLILMGLGFLTGGFLATTAILLLEMRDKSLKTVKEVKSAFDGYALLGLIPSETDKALPSSKNLGGTSLEIAVRDTPQSIASEMSHSIQSNLRFMGSETSLKKIVVTSSVANEGKAKVAANLAAAISQTGRRVLLIDADLRLPYQHKFWKLPLRKGLSEVLAKTYRFKTVAWRVMDNLDVLTTGSRSANSISCLDSVLMKSLIEDVSNLYDFVIIDAPPILVAADALSLGRMTDGVLLVSRPGVINAELAQEVQEKLRISRCNILGLIVNGVIQKYESNNHFVATQEYFSDEPESELTSTTDYLNNLGESIASQFRQDTGFTNNSTKKSTSTSKPQNNSRLGNKPALSEPSGWL